MLDMRAYGEQVVKFTHGLTGETFKGDDLRRLAVERALFIIGEAANRVPREVQTELPEIPWAAIIGLRNLLAHGYEIVSADRLWQTATVSVPELLKHLDAAIEKQPPFEI